jgi:hypothetical protein
LAAARGIELIIFNFLYYACFVTLTPLR